MWRLNHHPLCPFSRTVRLTLSEKRVRYKLRAVNPWKLDSGPTPTLHNPSRGIVLVDSAAICEFVEETVPEPPLLVGSAEQRAEIRRVFAWADEVLYRRLVRQPLLEAVAPGQGLTGERTEAGGNRAAQDTEPLLDELDHLLGTRAWLAGPSLSLADLAVAAHISVADYLGVVDWSRHEQAATWYAVLKSRRSFGALLADRVNGIEPPPHYSVIDH